MFTGLSKRMSQPDGIEHAVMGQEIEALQKTLATLGRRCRFAFKDSRFADSPTAPFARRDGQSAPAPAIH